MTDEQAKLIVLEIGKGFDVIAQLLISFIAIWAFYSFLVFVIDFAYKRSIIKAIKNNQVVTFNEIG